MGSTARRLTKNTMFSFLSSFTRLSANAVLFILVARFYGPEGFGQFTTAHTLSTVFILFADFGFDMLLTTELSQQRERTSYLLPRMFGVKLIFAGMGALAMCGYAWVQHMSEATRAMTMIFSLYLFFSALLNFLFALFKAHEEMHHESLITLIVNVFLLVCLAVLGVAGGGLYWVAAVFVLSRVLGLSMGFAKAKAFSRGLVPKFDVQWFRSVIKQVSVFGVYSVFGSLFFTLDTVLLSMWRGDYEVGIYQSVFRIIALSLVVPEIAVTAVLPSLSRLFVGEQEQWRRIGIAASKTLYFVGLLIGVVLIAAADTIIGVIYGGRGFQEAVGIMRLFGVIVAVRYSVEMSALMLTTSHRQHVRMMLVVGATVFNFALNSFAIPRFGIHGAAVVSLMTNLAVGAAYVVASAKDFREQWFTRERMMPLGVAVCSIGVIAILPSVPAWILLVPCVLVYAATVYTVGYSQEEKLLVVRATRREGNA
jgi:O-antigen/teichoic acid export membrane protein